MRLRIRFFAQLAQAAGSSALEVDVPDGSTVGELLATMRGGNDRLGETLLNMPTAVSVNARLAEPDTVIREGDEVALLPPVSGG